MHDNKISLHYNIFVIILAGMALHIHVAIKSMANSTTMLCSTLATTLHTLAGSGMQHSVPPQLSHPQVVLQPHDSNQYEYRVRDFVPPS